MNTSLVISDYQTIIAVLSNNAYYNMTYKKVGNNIGRIKFAQWLR